MGFMRGISRRISGALDARGHVDAVAGNRIAGWAFARSGPVRVNVRVGDVVVASVTPDIERRDVALAFPQQKLARHSGFVLELPHDVVPPNQLLQVVVEVRPATGVSRTTKLAQIAVAGSQIVERVTAAPETGIVGPFPRRVIDSVAALWPGACENLDGVEGQRAFAEKLGLILEVPALRMVPALADYARYLNAISSHFAFVDRYFPTENALAREDALDFHCKPNSVFEIFSIAHQLFVLKSYGVTGDFAEFGCFKGFSSAMLSYACQQLGLRMHIFDSFEGLPEAAGSGYVAGDYAGSLDEVTENVTRYGAASVVEFHKGFFSDTFKTYMPPDLICLWMDVDLELSSRDLMVVADRLDPRATLFSHECTADMFQNGEIVRKPSPDNPIPPMLDRFDMLGRSLTGRHVRGHTGSFWPRQGGIPALDNEVVMALAAVVSRPG